MKKIAFSILVTGLVAAGCGKENEYSNDFSSVVFINASPGSPAINVFIDTIQQTSAGVVFRGSSGYLSVQPGARNVELRTNVNFVTGKPVQAPNETFQSNTASTVFIYDTLSATNQTLRTLRLTDDLTPPANGSIKVRFVPLAPRQGAVDVTFLRTSATPADSVTLTNRSYVGATPTADAIQALSAFTTLPTGTYTVKLKAAGTQNVLATSTTALPGSGGFTGIYTVYSTGTAQGQALAISSFRHYP